MEMKKASDMKVHTLADSCMLAVLSRKRLATTRKVDNDTRDSVRTQLGDESLTLNKHLFKAGPVRELLRLLDRVYDHHKEVTAPYVDRGPRLLPSSKFDEYAEAMNEYELKLAAATAPIIADWERHVADDMADRASKATAAKAGMISREEYPSAYEAQHMFSMTWKVKPLPVGQDFRTQVPDYVKERLADEMNEAVDIIRADLLKRMLKPVQEAVKKLQIPIGDPGSVFRDSLVENLQSALKTAQDLNVGGDDTLTGAINEMRLIVHGHIGSPDTLRNMQDKREKAAAKLAALTDTLSGLQ